MPPVGMPRPDARYDSLITYLETELDRHAALASASPGLHRLNRTEYANAIRDLLALDVDVRGAPPSRRLEPRLRQHRRTCSRVSPALIERYLSAAGKSAGWPSATVDPAPIPTPTAYAATSRKTTTSKDCPSAPAAAC